MDQVTPSNPVPPASGQPNQPVSTYAPSTPPPPENGGGKGSMIASIIVVLILVAGAFYLFTSRSSWTPAPEPIDETPPPANGGTDLVFPPLGDSDDILDLEQEANALDFSDLDRELADIERELTQ